MRRYDTQFNGPRQNSHRYDVDCYGMVVAGNVTVNNITNVTNVTNVVRAHGYTPHGKWRRDNQPKREKHESRGKLRHEHKPKLLRFCQSCGMLDQDKVMRMSDGQLARELSCVADYANKRTMNDIRGIGHGLAKIGRGVCGMVSSAFGMVSSVLK